MRLTEMTRQHAEAIVTWRYAPPYETYGMTSTSPEFLLDEANCYFALVDNGGGLLGYRCFGAEGQVPGWTYDESALDTGGGLRPDLTGQGLGRSAIMAGLDFGRERFAPSAFRVTVAVFNERALRVVRTLGFADIATFHGSNGERDYAVLVRPERA